MKQNVFKKIYLDNLPRKGSLIDWVSSIGYKINFIYDDVKGEIEILDVVFVNDETKIKIKYEDYINLVSTGTLRYCRLGEIIGKISQDFKIEIGTKFQDNSRDITIIDRKYIKDKNGIKRKWYRYICNLCNFDGGKHYSIKDKRYKDENWVIEVSLLNQKSGCSCCLKSPQIVVENINSIVTTTPWMIPYFQGGIEEAKKYCKNSNEKVYFICPHCHQIRNKKKSILSLYSEHSIGCGCSDGKSYISKLIFNLLGQLNISFETEKKFDWCNFYNSFKSRYTYGFYDFFIKNKKLIIETDGGWHREDNKMSGQTKEESKYIDDEKDRLANENGIKVIRISDEGDIKQNILDSDLSKLFNLSNIDWLKAEEFALSNRIKEACKLWNYGIYSTKEISDIMKCEQATISRWLNVGNNYKWCNYNGKLEIIKSNKRINRPCKNIKIFKNNYCLGEFQSSNELIKYFEEKYNIKFNQANISAVCLGKRKQHKGFKFKYE